MTIQDQIKKILLDGGYILREKYDTGISTYTVCVDRKDGSYTNYCELNRYDALELARACNQDIKDDEPIHGATNFTPTQPERGLVRHYKITGG